MWIKIRSFCTFSRLLKNMCRFWALKSGYKAGGVRSFGVDRIQNKGVWREKHSEKKCAASGKRDSLPDTNLRKLWEKMRFLYYGRCRLVVGQGTSLSYQISSLNWVKMCGCGASKYLCHMGDASTYLHYFGLQIIAHNLKVQFHFRSILHGQGDVPNYFESGVGFPRHRMVAVASAI